MNKYIFLLLFCLISFNVSADNRSKIYSLENQSIFVSTAWAGQTFTLIKENDEYYISRHFLPSGVVEGPKKNIKLFFTVIIRYDFLMMKIRRISF